MPDDDHLDGADARAEDARRAGVRHRAGRVVGWSAAGMVGLAIAALATTAVLDAIDRRRVLPPGELVELAGGRRLHLQVNGPDGAAQHAVDGRPTVVLEAGSGGSAASMAWLHRELAADATVVAYDRAGYGFSDVAAGPLDAASVAADLREALGVLGLDGPYLLVGHSLGAAYVRVFAAEHPDEVVGLVLLDPVHEEQLARLPDEALERFDQARQQLAVAPLLARFGVFRLLDPQASIVAALPADAGEQHRSRSITPAGMRTYGREVVAMPQLLEEMARVDAEAPVGQAFGGMPVLIVSASDPADGETVAARQVMDALHRELAGRSPSATHVQVAGADHLSLVMDAGPAGEVAALVAGLLDTPTG
jgi:pimeloyl-ACP methyl ester carboxylesterase